MKKSELLKKLIHNYTEVAKGLTPRNWKSPFVRGMPMDCGVCDFARVFYSNDISRSKWVDYWTGFTEDGINGWTWCRLMCDCDSMREALQNIETRIEIMTHELESGIAD